MKEGRERRREGKKEEGSEGGREALQCNIISIKYINSIIPTKEQLSDNVVYQGKKVSQNFKYQSIKVQRQGRNKKMCKKTRLLWNNCGKEGQEDYLYLLYMHQMQGNLLVFLFCYRSIVGQSSCVFSFLLYLVSAPFSAPSYILEMKFCRNFLPTASSPNLHHKTARTYSD